MSILNQVISYEQGELDEEGIIDLFQELITSGMAWKMQGSYGRTASALINAGYCAEA